MNETATAPGGIVHYLAGDNTTRCGQPATGWSREVTQLQELGLVPFCKACEQAPA